MSKTNVVIIGGGMGAVLTRDLSAKLDASSTHITLIDARPFRVHLIAMARITVTDEGHLEDDAFAPLDKLPFKGTFVQGRAARVETELNGTKGEVVLQDGQRVPFDVLVLAPGSIWPGAIQLPDDAEGAKEVLRQSREEVKNAKKVVIAGAGAVGLEIAGEVKDVYPNTEVTVVHGAKSVAGATYPDKFRKALKKSFTDRGVKFVFEDYIDTFPSAAELKNNGSVTTRNGVKIEADLVIKSTGPTPATDFLSSENSSFGDNVLTAQGHIAVKPTLQLLNHPNIFALGDAIDWKEQKQAAKAQNHVGLLGANIPAFLAKQPLKDYAGSTEMIAVTNGKNGGTMYADVLWGLVLGSWIVSFVKSKTLLISMFKTASGTA